MSKKTYTLLVRRSTEIHYDIEANSKDEAIDVFNKRKDKGKIYYSDWGYREDDIESNILKVKEAPVNWRI